MTRPPRLLPSRRIAVIDVGTNSIKLQVAHVSNRSIRTICFERETTRMGIELATKTRIGPSATGRVVRVLRRFARVARRHHAEETLAFSTWALRRAANRDAIVRRLQRQAGVNVRVLSGAMESRMAWEGATSALRSQTPKTLVVDVGGGSVELVIGINASALSHVSLPLGALVLTAKFLSRDPIETTEFMRLQEYAARRLESWLSAHVVGGPSALNIVLTGGAATTVAAMSATKAHRHPRDVSSGELSRLRRECLRRTIDERAHMKGLPADRAEIIPAGIAVIGEVLRQTHKRSARVSSAGVREGVLRHLYDRDLQWRR